MIILLALLQAGLSALNFGFYSHSHATISLVAGVVAAVGTIWTLIVASAS